jgi:hypothetical protein
MLLLISIIVITYAYDSSFLQSNQILDFGITIISLTRREGGFSINYLMKKTIADQPPVFLYFLILLSFFETFSEEHDKLLLSFLNVTK